MKTRNVIIYPEDSMDGAATAWVAADYFSKRDPSDEIYLHPVKHGAVNFPIFEFDDSTVNRLILADVSAPVTDIATWCHVNKPISIDWFDQMPMAEHSMELLHRMLNGTGIIINTVYSDAKNECGCTLAWKTFFPNDALPITLFHVQDRDSWTFRHQHTRDWFAGAVGSIHDSSKWTEIFNDDNKNKTIEIGSHINAYIKNQVSRYTNREQQFISCCTPDGPAKAIAINVPRELVSEVSNDLLASHPNIKFVVCYQVLHDSVKFDLRSRSGLEFNCRQFAELFGGGGRATTAGVTLQRTVWRLGPFLNKIGLKLYPEA